MSCQRELMTYGFMLDKEAFEILKAADTADISQFYQDCTDWLKEWTGGKSDYQSLYKNFPVDVMSMTDTEYFWGQLLHYWTACEFLPVGTEKESAFEQTSYTPVRACTEKEFMVIFTNLLSVVNSLTPTDTKIIKWFAASGLTLDYPATIPFKENLAVIASLCPDFKASTVTDVLRIAVGLSGGDVSLPAVPRLPKRKGPLHKLRSEARENFKFKLSPEHKTRVLSLLENCPNLDVSQMNQGRKYGRWVRLFEHLRVETRISEFPVTALAAKRLRNQKRKGNPDGNEKVRGWYAQVEQGFKAHFKTGAAILADRPGEFLRRLDWMLRKYSPNQTSYILEKLYEVAVKASNKVLFEVYTHFENRKTKQERKIFVKGARKATTLPTLAPLDTSLVEAVQETIWKALQEKFKSLPALGKCYIDPELKKIPLPTNMRSLSEGLKPVIRGQRVPIGEKGTLRAFVHWLDEHGTQDIDLHGFLIGKEVQSMGYNGGQEVRLRENNKLIAAYSGDVRHRRGACAEYIDLDIAEVTRLEMKYYVQIAHNFENEPFSKLKECFTGYMTTESPEKNNTWVPSNVQNCFSLTTEANYCLVGIFDLITREYIHLDLDYGTDIQRMIGGADIAGVMNYIRQYCEPPKVSVYDLVRMHVEARGQSVGFEDSDVQFMSQDYVHSYDKTLLLMGV